MTGFRQSHPSTKFDYITGHIFMFSRRDEKRSRDLEEICRSVAMCVSRRENCQTSTDAGGYATGKQDQKHEKTNVRTAMLRGYK